MNGKVSGMFLSRKPLFGGSGDAHAIDDQGRCRIVALRNPVLPLRKARPVGFLKRDRVFQAANPENFHAILAVATTLVFNAATVSAIFAMERKFSISSSAKSILQSKSFSRPSANSTSDVESRPPA